MVLFQSDPVSANIGINLNILRQEGKFCDFTLKVADRAFPVHRAVLLSVKSFFNDQHNLCSDKHTSTLELSEYLRNVDGFDDILTFVYTGSVDICDENVVGLLVLSNRLPDSGLHEAVLDYLGDNLTPKNIFNRYFFSLQENKLNLQCKCELYYIKQFPSIFLDQRFKNLSLDMFRKLFESLSTTFIFPENSYQLIVEWIRHDPNERARCLNGFLQQIPVEKMTKSSLEWIVLQERLITQYDDLRRKIAEIHQQKVPNVIYVLNCNTAERIHKIKLYKNWRCVKPFTDVLRRYIYTVYQHNLYILGQSAADTSQSLYLQEFNTKTRTARVINTKVETSQTGLLTSFSMCSFEGKLYLSSTKCDAQEPKQMYSAFECFSFETQTWETLHATEEPRNDSQLLECDEHLYSIGGWNTYGRTSLVEKYDRSRDQWNFMAQPWNRYSTPSVAALNGRIFIMDTENFEVYLPNRDIWIKLPYPWSFDNVKHAKLAVIDERLFAYGGSVENLGCRTIVLIFEPQTLSWVSYPTIPYTVPEFEIAAITQ